MFNSRRNHKTSRPSMLETMEQRMLMSACPHAPALSEAQVDPQAAVLSEFIVLGDSLSDIGEIFGQTGNSYPADPPYHQGRFSDGPVWVEHLAPALGLESTDENNYAVGGAQTGNTNVNDTVDQEFDGLADQVNEFAARAIAQGGADPDALYVVWAGPNDFLTPPGGVIDEAFIGSVITNIATAVGTLSQLGAQHIMVPSLPNLGLTPRAIGAGLDTALTELSFGFNQALQGALGQLAAGGVDTIYVDVFGKQNEVAADPGAYGFTVDDMPAIDLTTLELVGDPAEHVFFDDIHPTSASHEILADAARDAVYDAGLLPQFTVSRGQPLRFTDADGDRVTVRLTGQGEATVRLLGDRSDIAHLVLEGTNERSNLIITTHGRSETTVYDVDVRDTMGRIIARKTDLINDLNVGDKLRLLLVGDFAGDGEQTIHIGGDSDLRRDTFRLIAKSVHDGVELESGVPTWMPRRLSNMLSE